MVAMEIPKDMVGAVNELLKLRKEGYGSVEVFFNKHKVTYWKITVTKKTKDPE